MYIRKTNFIQTARRLISALTAAAIFSIGCLSISYADEIATASDTTATPTLWVAGDSTAAEFSDNYYYPRYGWGTQLYRYFQGLDIRNLAVSGTSTKSYTSTDSYTTLLSDMKEGDYLLIGFGHNDEKAESARYTNPNGSVTTPGSTRYYLYENFIRPAQEAGVTPIVCTPIVRRDPDGNYNGASAHIIESQTTIEGTFEGGDYAKAISSGAVGKNALVIDLTTRTKLLYQSLGTQGSKWHHAFSSPNEVSIDNTHTNLYGAAYNAYLIADEIAKSSSSLKDYLIDTPEPPDFSILIPNPDYTFQTYVRPESDSTKWTAAGDWKPTVFGDVEALEYLNDIYFHFIPYENGAIRIAAGRQGGTTSDIVGASVGKISTDTDGIAMYYQAVPADQNFTLTAYATINSIDPNNQASFGLMARDDIYVDYVTNDTLGDYVAAASLMMGSDTPWNCFARKSGVLTRGDYTERNYIDGETVRLEIRKTSDGYTCTYGSNPPVSAGFDFPLTRLDPEYIYVGMFAARSADVTFWDVQLTLD
ncbi:MAG: carbohydrate esterase family 12 protein [Clostridiales bacterium]|nr:carbohydrate esterase family 12 protein [Clostridiales bacterium]